jgi:predicted nucleic acid-binding protein
MKLLVDVNVVLDVLLERHPHVDASAALWAAVERRAVEGFVSAHGVTTVFYLVARHRDARLARRVVSDLVSVFGIAPVDAQVIRRALDLAWADFEDAVCAAAAEASACDAVVTRDPRGFVDPPVPVLDPIAALAWVDESRGPERISERVATNGSREARAKPGTARRASRRVRRNTAVQAR